MYADLLAGTVHTSIPALSAVPKIVVFDSGLGGLTVLGEVRKARPDASIVYAADDAGFPYGRLEESALIARVTAVFEHLVASYEPDLAVIACNTASTLVLPHLRARFPLPFVGTVPAIKPAVLASRSQRVSVLATPGTVIRDYTQDLIRHYAKGCAIELVGSRLLAEFAEREMEGFPVSDQALMTEIAPCFTRAGDLRTDIVVLACTHYPLLLPRLRRLAPWPVEWIDPAPAIARRVTQLLGEGTQALAGDALALFTAGTALNSELRSALVQRGLSDIVIQPMPL